MIHKIKIWPEYFDLVLSGKKSFEIRKNDRNYNVGDMLVLQEFNPKNQEYTGDKMECSITYIFEGTGDFGIEKGYVVMSIEVLCDQ